VKGSLLRYRVMAWVVGVMLLAVTAATIIKYVSDDPTWIERVGPPHGFLYVIYLVTVIDLALRVRWSFWRTVWICIAGTIPFVSFFVEHWVTQEVRAGQATESAVSP
jgi:integral membrane protein